MKPKAYRLKTVLKMREISRDEAGRQVAQRLEELEDAQNELARRQNDLLACYEKQDQKQLEMDEMIESGTRVKSVVAHRAFLGDLRESEQELQSRAEKQKKSVLRAEGDLDTARDKLVDATRDFKAIETHRSKWAAGVRADAIRRDQKTSDEIGNILYGGREKE